MLEQEHTSNIEINLLDEKIYKTKSYVRKAVNKYRNKKMQLCPEFKEKVMESNRIYREKNKDKLNEKQRLYMQEYRRKKKMKVQIQLKIQLKIQLLMQMILFKIKM